MDDEIEIIYKTPDGLEFYNEAEARAHARRSRDVENLVEAYAWSGMSKYDLVHFIMDHAYALRNILHEDYAEQQSESST